MAISFIGSAVGSSSPNAATTITLPTLNADDLIIIAAAVGDTANNGIPAPTGYSRVPGVAATLYSNDVNDTNLDLYYKIAVAGDSGANVTLTATGGTNASNAGIAMVFRGIDTTTPFDVNATTATGIDTSNANPPSLDHLNPAGVWTVIAASTGHTGGATGTFTFPTGYTTNAAQRVHNDTIDALAGMGYNTAPADPENPAAFSAANIGTATDNAWAAVTMALRPSTNQTFPQTVTAGATLASATRQLQANKIVTAAALMSATISREVSKIVTAAALVLTATLQAAFTVFSTLTAGALTITATMTRGLTLGLTVAASALITATMSRGLAFGRTLSAIVTLVGQLGRFRSYGSPFLFTTANWGGSVQFYLEVYMRAASGTARARLYNETDGTAVASSDVTTASSSYVRVRSSSVTLVDGNVYSVQFGSNDNDGGAFRSGKLVAI